MRTGKHQGPQGDASDGAHLLKEGDALPPIHTLAPFLPTGDRAVCSRLALHSPARTTEARPSLQNK